MNLYQINLPYNYRNLTFPILPQELPNSTVSKMCKASALAISPSGGKWQKSGEESHIGPIMKSVSIKEIFLNSSNSVKLRIISL
mmetsp:Transcript_477/g.961  ORF Transcript_477/g.961 Transcript_477/m.961 type:complete len:84 (-) Transcript_477:1706-1957(-)